MADLGQWNVSLAHFWLLPLIHGIRAGFSRRSGGRHEGGAWHLTRVDVCMLAFSFSVSGNMVSVEAPRCSDCLEVAWEGKAVPGRQDEAERPKEGQDIAEWTEPLSCSRVLNVTVCLWWLFLPAAFSPNGKKSSGGKIRWKKPFSFSKSSQREEEEHADRTPCSWAESCLTLLLCSRLSRARYRHIADVRVLTALSHLVRLFLSERRVS